MRFNNQKGISLVEIIAAIAIIGIVAISFSTSIGIMMRNEQYAKQLQHNTQIGQTIMENLANETHIPLAGDTTYAGVSKLEFGENQLDFQGVFEDEVVTFQFTKTQQLVEQADLKISIQKQLNGETKAVITDYQSNQSRTETITAKRLEISYEDNGSLMEIVVKPHENGLGSISYKTTSQWPIILLEFEFEFPVFIISTKELLKIHTQNYHPQGEPYIKTRGTVQLQANDVVQQMGTLYTVEIEVGVGTPHQFSTVKQIVLQRNQR